MNKPEDMFDILTEDTTEVGDLGFTWRKRTHYLVYKATGEKYFPSQRKHGYSQLRDAKSARTRLFNDYMKKLEETLLG